MRNHHGDSVATMAAVSAAGFLSYRTKNPINDGILFPKLLSIKSGVTLEEVLTFFDLGSWNLIYFFHNKDLGHYQKDAVESDDAYYDRVSRCDVCKLSLDLAAGILKLNLTN